MKKLIAAGLVALAMTACASRSETISAAYVTPMTYQPYTFAQLRAEATRVSTRAIQVTGAQDQKATNDAVGTGVDVVLFWPALLFIKGDSTTAAELARLKGEMEAIEQASVRKNCGIMFQRQAAS